MERCGDVVMAGVERAAGGPGGARRGGDRSQVGQVIQAAGGRRRHWFTEAKFACWFGQPRISYR